MDETDLVCSNPRCEASIGKIVEVEGEILLQVGGLLVSKIDGVCINCGRKFHWWVTDRLLESILSRLISKEKLE